MEELFNKFDMAKTFEEQCEYAKAWIMEQSWGGFLKWEEFSVRDLILFFPCMEDEDTTVWKDGTPEEERVKGTKAIKEIDGKLIITMT